MQDNTAPPGFSPPVVASAHLLNLAAHGRTFHANQAPCDSAEQGATGTPRVGPVTRLAVDELASISRSHPSNQGSVHAPLRLRDPA